MYAKPFRVIASFTTKDGLIVLPEPVELLATADSSVAVRFAQRLQDYGYTVQLKDLSEAPDLTHVLSDAELDAIDTVETLSSGELAFIDRHARNMSEREIVVLDIVDGRVIDSTTGEDLTVSTPRRKSSIDDLLAWMAESPPSDLEGSL